MGKSLWRGSALVYSPSRAAKQGRRRVENVSEAVQRLTLIRQNESRRRQFIERCHSTALTAPQALNEEPQPQVDFTFGLLNLNPEPSSVST